MWRTFSLFVIFCAVIIDCRKYNDADYYRNKRGKHYSTLPYKYYNRPSYTSSNRNPIRYSPQYGHSPNDIGPPASKIKPYKVSKNPINEGLGDEDFHNLINYLSKQDLDKIVEFAAEKDRYSDKYIDSTDNYEYGVSESINNDNNIIFKNIGYDDIPNVQFDYNEYNDFESGNLNTNYPQHHSIINSMYSQIPINAEELEEIQQFSLVDMEKEIREMNSDRNNIFTDSSTMQEEQLPKPINLREDDYDVSFTNKVPSVVKPENFSYRLENFADLPLMEYANSKLETVNSYSVPHYSVTSSNHRPRYTSQSQPASAGSSSSLSSSILSLINAPRVEPAPPVSVAKEQSDAHLKAIKIWTHKSKGTAYTLHDDGTLSLESPSGPRYKYP